jgi:hypothetical protein
VRVYACEREVDIYIYIYIYMYIYIEREREREREKERVRENKGEEGGGCRERVTLPTPGHIGRSGTRQQ